MRPRITFAPPSPAPRRPRAARSWSAACSARAILLGLALLGLLGCGGGPSDEDLRRSRAEYDLGVGLFGEQNIAGAFQHLREAVRLDPENVEAHMVLGTLHMLRGERDDAERHLREAIAINQRLGPSGLPALTPDAYNTLGVLYINAHRYEDAVEALRASTSDLMNRTPHLAWGNLGWALTELRRYADARDALNQAVRLQPQFCAGWYRLGALFIALGQRAADGEPDGEASGFEQAEAALTHALEVDRPECRALQDAWLLRGETRARLGRREEAVEDFERCVELDANTEAGRSCAGLLSSGS